MTPDFRDPALKAVSFDIFDTLIQRVCLSPGDVFALLEPLAAELSGGALRTFQQIRPWAERLTRLRSRNRQREILLGDIYRTLTELGLLPSQAARELMGREIEAEKRLLVRREAGGRLFEEAKASGLKVFLISDMYLPENFVVEILSGLDLTGYDALYLSSTRGAMKYYGDLFELVLTKEDLSPQELLHIGDNEISDLKVPAALGLKTFHLAGAFADFKNNPANQAMYQKGFPDSTVPESSLFPSLCLGLECAEYYGDPARSVPGDSRFGGDPFHFGYAAVGPAATGFALWLAEKVRRDGTERLYFLSRDAFLLKKAFDILRPHLDLDVQTFYLHNSRKISLSAAMKNSADIIGACLSYFQPMILGKFLNDKFGLTVEEIGSEFLTKYDLTPGTTVGMYSRDQLIPLCLELSPLIFNRSEEKRRALSVYLQQQSFTAPGSSAVVDIGFSGVIQEALAEVSGRRDLRGYYYFTDYRAVRPQAQGLAMESFFENFCDTFSPQFPHKYLYHFYFETFFKETGAGPLDDLRLDEAGNPEPIIRPLIDERTRGLTEQVLTGAEKFTKDLAARFGPWLKQLRPNAYSASMPYLSFLSAPTPRDAAMLEGLLIDDSFCGTDRRYFLAPSSEAGADSLWKEGAAAVSINEKVKS